MINLFEPTLTLEEALEKDSTLIDELDVGLTGHKLKEMFTNIYAERHLGTTELDTFKKRLKRYHHKWLDYYLEVLEAYNTDVNWTDGDVDSETRADSGSTDFGHRVTTESHSQGNALPNKRVASTTTTTYATTSGDDTQLQVNDGKDEYASTSNTTRKHGNKVELREAYINTLHNIYMEWCEKFEPLFGLLC